MAIRLSDPKTLQAMGILADSLDHMAGPENLECMMAANAIRQVLETKSEMALRFARQAFESLEPELRQQVHNDATDNAVKMMKSQKRGAAITPKRGAKGSGSPFLDAVNRGSGPMKTERKW
jgi:hypothetical protein